MGLFDAKSCSSILRVLCVALFLWREERVLWHTGAVGIGFLLNEYVWWVENTKHTNTKTSHYGLSHYAMFRFFHNKLLPASHMWVLFTKTGLKDCGDKIKNGLRFDGVSEGSSGSRQGGEAADPSAVGAR
jgi:hypothetical protein